MLFVVNSINITLLRVVMKLRFWLGVEFSDRFLQVPSMARFVEMGIKLVDFYT